MSIEWRCSMAVRWDSVLVHSLSRELDRRLRRRRCRSYLLDGPNRTIWLFCDDICVEMRLAVGQDRISLHEATPPHNDARGLVAEILSVSSPPDERRLVLSLLRKRGRSRRVDLVLELAQNRRNVLLVERPEGRIVDCLPYRGPGGGNVRPGALYEPPPPPTRLGQDGILSFAEWASSSVDRKQMLNEVAWTSPINVESLLRDPRAGYALWKTLAGEEAEPVILDTPNGPQPYPNALPEYGSRPVPDLLSAFEAAAETLHGTGDSKGTVSAPVDPEAVRRIARRKKGVKRELASVRRELARTVEPDTLRETGNLILARISELRRGLATATLLDFEGRSIDVPLDPRLEPHENADRYFREAGKATRAREKLPIRIRTLEGELAALQKLRNELEAGTATLEDVPQWAEKEKERDQNDPRDPLPYRRYATDGGLEVRVGRGAGFNDDLTFRHSRPDDIWLHARDVAGAHVILRWTGTDNPPRRDLEQAASLAALHSKSRHSGTVPVDWTRRKYVRKPRGAAPGSVVPDRVKTVFVSPDQAHDVGHPTDSQ